METSFLNPSEALGHLRLHEGMKVADLGAGSGFFTRAAARIVGETGVVWAVDVHRDLLPRLKNLAHAEGLNNVEVIHGDIEHMGGSHLPAEQFDACILANILFAAHNKHAAIAEVKRILKNGGRALVIDWSASFSGMGPHKDHVVTARTARGMFEEAGLVWVDDVPAGAYHWGFVVRKKATQAAE